MDTTGPMVGGLITAAAITLHAAVVSHSAPQAVASVVAAFICALGVGQSIRMRNELRGTRIALERASRPAPLLPSTDQVVTDAIAGACCEAWWASAGAEHDPEQCSR